MFDHWAKYPPVHISVALFTAIKPATTKAAVNDATVTFIEAMPKMRPRIAGRAP